MELQVPNIIGIPKRSKFSSVDEGKAISKAIRAARGNIHPCPVIHGNKIIGFVRGKSVYSDLVYFMKVPAQYSMVWSNYNDIISSLTNTKRYSSMWHKTFTTTGSVSNWADCWGVNGRPGAGSVAGTAFIANKWDDTSTGAIQHGGNVSTDVKCILSALFMESVGNAPETVLIYDRVLDYQNNTYNANSNQAMTNTNTAQRYISSGQPGLQMVWAMASAHNGTASNITQLQYTDDSGNTLQSMPTGTTVSILTSGTAPSTVVGARVMAPATAGGGSSWGPFMPLAAGDTGVRLVANYTTSAANTGTFHLALVYPIAYVPITGTGVYSHIDYVYQIPSLERIYDGACLSVMTFGAGGSMTGVIDVGWG